MVSGAGNNSSSYYIFHNRCVPSLLDFCCIDSWLSECVEPAHHNVWSKVNVYADNEMMFWNTSWLLSHNGGYNALRSSSARWNKLLNVSLLHVLPVFTHIWRQCADTLLNLLSLHATAHVTHNLTGPLRCRTVDSVAFEPCPPNAKSLYLFQPRITWTDSKAGGLVPIWLDDTWGNCANKKVWCGPHCVLIAREVVN